MDYKYVVTSSDVGGLGSIALKLTGKASNYSALFLKNKEINRGWTDVNVIRPGYIINVPYEMLIEPYKSEVDKKSETVAPTPVSRPYSYSTPTSRLDAAAAAATEASKKSPELGKVSTAMPEPSKKTSIKKEIYPESFFKFSHPTSPWFSVQFRSSIANKDDITDDNNWTEMATNPNNFVENIEITDTGGARKLTLSLIDRDFNFVETYIMRAIFITRITNEEIKKASTTLATKDLKDELTLDFLRDTQNVTNVRVRFGYTDTGENFNDIKMETSGKSNVKNSFTERTENEKPTSKSPWIYFMINGVVNEMTESGLKVTLQGLSLGNSFLSNIKMIQKFAKIVGSPRKIIESLNHNLKSVKDGDKKTSIEIAEFGNDASGGLYSEIPVVDDDGKEADIEVVLGGIPTLDRTGKLVEKYKSIKEILDEICLKTPPMYIDDEGEIVKRVQSKETGINGEGEHILNYSYMLEAKEDGTNVIVFYYPNGSKQQKYLRVYDWRENSRTIVKNATIQTATDFATMSQKIYINGAEGDKSEYQLMSGLLEDKIRVNNEATSTSLNVNLKALDWRFVSAVENVSASNSGASGNLEAIYNQFLVNINRQVFRGTLEIPGDPFFLFDRSLRPFEFLIKLNVYRPLSKIKEDNNINQKSYLSGLYAVTSIKHTIGASGFETSLEIMRWPEKKDTLKV